MKRRYKYFKPFLKNLIALDKELSYIPKVIIDGYNMTISVVDGRNDYNRFICECEYPDNFDSSTVAAMITGCIDCDIVII